MIVLIGLELQPIGGRLLLRPLLRVMARTGYVMKDDEAKLIASTRESAQQLLQIFEADSQEEAKPGEPVGAAPLDR